MKQTKSGHSRSALLADTAIRLTPAEERLLPYIKQGFTYSAIATSLGLSIGTVKNQVYQIAAKVPPDPHTSTFRRVQRWALTGT